MTWRKDYTLFMAGRIGARPGLAVLSVAVSFFVMVLAVMLSHGFRDAVSGAVRAASGDVVMMSPYMDPTSDGHPVVMEEGFLARLKSLPQAALVQPVVYKAGVLRGNGAVSGVLFKGVDSTYDFTPFMKSLTEGGFPSFGGRKVSSEIVIPRAVADELQVGAGDRIDAYFIGETVRARRFDVAGVYESLMANTDGMAVFADIRNIARLNSWVSGECSCVELTAAPRTPAALLRDAVERTVDSAGEGEVSSVIVTDTGSRYPGIFDWLNLLDFNLYVILLLMFAVAGFNMVSGVLIILFENISFIGLMKALGMRDRNIFRIFLCKASAIVLKGMAAGNAVALAAGALQKWTGLMKLDPRNYVINVVPVSFDWASVAAVNVAAYAAIMCLLLVTSAFISRVDPARTVKML